MSLYMLGINFFLASINKRFFTFFPLRVTNIKEKITMYKTAKKNLKFQKCRNHIGFIC